MSNFNITDMTAKLQQLQKQVDQFNQMQTQTQPVQPNAPAASTYPRIIRSDTVEDILNNPQWRQELESEFNNSEICARAKKYTDVVFMEFCESQTGKPSTMLDGLRKEAEKNKDKKPTKKSAESEGGSKE